ncbi:MULTISPECIES: hypothetical protein [unclassified Streptomyces]|uniref:hypothetical protein n=1 Tax=unclassified Streptomyces TaxID=2593676 RepID=UPI00224DAC57|nr:hypothetical protein [Streptomyces sp. NBC_00047]MCX5612624.1 hypothetical protein [Streptomyces sp. NBC_00047]
MPRSHKKQLAAALTASLGALAYTVSKVDLARAGELGMPGFPAPAEAYAAVADVETAQLANAALGLLMAVVALLLVRLPGTPLVRWPALVVSWAGIAMVGAGVLGFGARAAGLAPGLGATPPHMPTALAALLVGAVWVTAWTIATVSATRSSRRRCAASANL